jgi:hypothetical protein
VIVGVNVVGAQLINDEQQNALIEQLQKDGVKTVRTRIGAQVQPESVGPGVSAVC